MALTILLTRLHLPTTRHNHFTRARELIPTMRTSTKRLSNRISPPKHLHIIDHTPIRSISEITTCHPSFSLSFCGAAAVTQTTPAAVTTSALVALRGVRHCDGATGEQNKAPLARETVAERTAVTRPTPNAPSVLCTRPCTISKT